MNKLRNFEFEYNGEKYWYSRSITVATCIFCKDSDGNWCALINKRGKGCPTAVGKWNVPAGYLDHDEDRNYRLSFGLLIHLRIRYGLFDLFNIFYFRFILIHIIIKLY